MRRSIFKMSLLTLSLLIFSIACNKDDKADEGFSLVGTWSLEKVEVSANLPLVGELSDTDADPFGTITFSNQGLGRTAYQFTLLNEPYASAGSFAWEKDGDTVTIVDAAGTDTWKILESSEKKLIAEWTEIMEGSEQGTYKIELSK
ncbi:MAG: hypothetical protein HKN87_01185 [Saprospiraceae bacterium]|nr:hypothetical protein [Saprospiraceae bacterium]